MKGKNPFDKKDDKACPPGKDKGKKTGFVPFKKKAGRGK